MSTVQQEGSVSLEILISQEFYQIAQSILQIQEAHLKTREDERLARLGVKMATESSFKVSVISLATYSPEQARMPRLCTRCQRG